VNAIQSMKGGGALYVNIWEAEDRVLLGIGDNGCGISEENMRRIFNPFFTTKGRGSGLGLSIVKKIIEGHGGSIWLKSQEGVGTKVMIELPLAASVEKPLPAYGDAVGEKRFA
jgi:signal transduction histidine kinase